MERLATHGWIDNGVAAVDRRICRYGTPQHPAVVLRVSRNMTLDAAAEPDWGALIAAVAERRDKTAFARLFERFAPRVKAYVMRLGTDPATAEELAQEVMISLWQKAVQFDPDKASAATWIFTIARNRRIDALRRERRPEIDPDDPVLAPDPEPAADDALARDRQDETIRAVVSSLPSEQQEVIRLAFFEDRSHGDIAAKLNLPLGTVKSRLRLAFGKLRSVMEESA